MVSESEITKSIQRSLIFHHYVLKSSRRAESSIRVLNIFHAQESIYKVRRFTSARAGRHAACLQVPWKISLSALLES